MDKFKSSLKKLLDARLENRKNLINEEYTVTQMKEGLLSRELKIKIDLECEISNADQAVIKTKYSNAEKRRLELEKRLWFDVEIKTMKSAILEINKNILEYETKEALMKLEERYLFKTIDLHIAELTTKEKSKCLEKVEKG